jgi:uncharacterized protein YvpB
MEVRGPVAALVVLATLVSSMVSPGVIGVAQAADQADVGGWATLGSVTPAAGCWVDANIEVRREGFTIGNVDVAVDLAHNGEIVASDAGATDANGLAYLGLDTSWAAPGDDAWLDVTVGGQYAGGMPLTITDSGGCGDNPGMVPIGAQIALPDAGETAQSGSQPISSTPMVDVGVPTYTQQRNLSCEYAAAVIAMGAYGVWVSEYAFDDIVGWSDNPHWGYRGDITGWWGNTDDYGVYAEALVPALANFGFRGEVFYGQGNPNALTARLDAGLPVLVWVGLWGNDSFYQYAADGTTYKLAAGQHVVVAYGYDDSGVYVSDPAHGTKEFFTWGTFMTYWNVLDGMSLAVSPY